MSSTYIWAEFESHEVKSYNEEFEGNFGGEYYSYMIKWQMDIYWIVMDSSSSSAEVWHWTVAWFGCLELEFEWQYEGSVLVRSKFYVVWGKYLVNEN